MCMQNSHQALRSKADGVEDGEEGGNVAEEHEIILWAHLICGCGRGHDCRLVGHGRAGRHRRSWLWLRRRLLTCPCHTQAKSCCSCTRLQPRCERPARSAGGTREAEQDAFGPHVYERGIFLEGCGRGVPPPSGAPEHAAEPIRDLRACPRPADAVQSRRHRFRRAGGACCKQDNRRRFTRQRRVRAKAARVCDVGMA